MEPPDGILKEPIHPMEEKAALPIPDNPTDPSKGESCPDCRGPLVPNGRCRTCPLCGWSTCG